MTLKQRQVLRTRIPLTSDGRRIPPGTRVVVMSFPRKFNGKPINRGERVKVTIADPARDGLNGVRLVTTPGSFKATHRGRPVGTTKEVLEARTSA